jgi:mono/diheme cytochrome c family protein
MTVWPVRALCAALVLLSGTAVHGQSSSQDRGRALFMTGATDDPAARAVIGLGDVSIPATAVPCASCHGADGRGRPEGRIIPPDISGPSLAAASAATPNRRARPGYDAAAIVRAVTTGIDAGGDRLDPVMPRFALSRADADALVAFLRYLGTTPDPGAQADAVVIGTVQRKNAAPLGLLLGLYFAHINRDGALFGRAIRLVSAQFGPDETPSAAIGRLVSNTAVFALVANWLESSGGSAGCGWQRRQSIARRSVTTRLAIRPRRIS